MYRGEKAHQMYEIRDILVHLAYTQFPVDINFNIVRHILNCISLSRFRFVDDLTQIFQRLFIIVEV